MTAGAKGLNHHAPVGAHSETQLATSNQVQLTGGFDGVFLFITFDPQVSTGCVGSK